jgi:hypothetical protein
VNSAAGLIPAATFRGVVDAPLGCHDRDYVNSTEATMRRKNMRLVAVGSVLIVLAIAFFLFFLSIAAKSNDPAALMRTVGTVSGVVIGIAVAMIAVGLIGKESGQA